MINLVLPKVESDALSRHYGRFVIGPLEEGYGVTLGNSLRRVLLSSLPGAAITSLRISGVHHEFSTMPHVREDVTSIMLNLKQIRFKFAETEEEMGRLRLEVRGEGVVTAGDLVCPPYVEVVNPEAYLLTTDAAQAEVEMEMTVSLGRGYSPAEERGKLPVGELPTDAIFSPIRKANYIVERARVGQATNFDRLILEIWTDGTLRPAEALSTSARILLQHLDLLANFGAVPAPEEAPPEVSAIPAQFYEVAVEDLELTVRAYNCLKRAGITKVGEVLERLERSEDELLSIRNFGQKSLEELKERLAEKGFWPLPAG